MFDFSRLVSINFIIGFLIILGISMGIHSINQKLDRIQELENILSDTQMETSNAVDKLSESVIKGKSAERIVWLVVAAAIGAAVRYIG